MKKKKSKRETYKAVLLKPIHVRLKEEGTPINTDDKAIMSAMVLHMNNYDTIYKLNKLIAKYPHIAKEIIMS